MEACKGRIRFRVQAYTSSHSGVAKSSAGKTPGLCLKTLLNSGMVGSNSSFARQLSSSADPATTHGSYCPSRASANLPKLNRCSFSFESQRPTLYLHIIILRPSGSPYERKRGSKLMALQSEMLQHRIVHCSIPKQVGADSHLFAQS